jgi:hypothetical protein
VSPFPAHEAVALQLTLAERGAGMNKSSKKADFEAIETEIIPKHKITKIENFIVSC